MMRNPFRKKKKHPWWELMRAVDPLYGMNENQLLKKLVETQQEMAQHFKGIMGTDNATLYRCPRCERDQWGLPLGTPGHCIVCGWEPIRSKQEEKMSDLKWGYPELLDDGLNKGMVRICGQIKDTNAWLSMSSKEVHEKWGCSYEDYRVYRAIIQRWHDQQKIQRKVKKHAEKAKAEKPQFGPGDYVVFGTLTDVELVEDNITDGEGRRGLKKMGAWGRTFVDYSDIDKYRPATPPEIEAFRKELAENLGLRYDTWVEYKGKEYRIADHDLKAGKPDGEILLKGAGFNVKIQDWPSLKVVEPKEQVKPDGPTDKQVLEACYEVRKKIEACEGDWMVYEWRVSRCALCILFGLPGSGDLQKTRCKGRCPFYDCDEKYKVKKHKSLTPLSEAVDKAIAELEGKMKPKFEVGQWVEDTRDKDKGIVIKEANEMESCEVEIKDGSLKSWWIGQRIMIPGKYLTPCDSPSDTPEWCPGYEPPAKPSGTPSFCPLPPKEKSDTPIEERFIEIRNEHGTNSFVGLWAAIHHIAIMIERLAK